MSQIDISKLVRILGMLGSDNAGERDTAARFANDMVKKAGTSWEKILSPPAAIVQNFEWKPSQWNTPPPPKPPLWKQDAMEALRYPEIISDREKEFLTGLLKRRAITEKQAKWLDDILKRIPST